MWIVKNLKTDLYLLHFVPKNQVIWHSNKEYATRFEGMEEAEDLISEVGINRDEVKIERE